MSERPMTEDTKFSRLRRPVGRLRDLPIWSKLGLIMIVPTIATIVVGTAGLIENVNSARGADDARAAAKLAMEAGALIHDLQNERAAAVLYAGASPSTKAAAKETLQKQIPLTDKSLTAVRQSRQAVKDVNDEAAPILKQVSSMLTDLGPLRKQLLGTNEVAQSTVAFRYRVMIAALLDARETASRLTSTSSLQTSQQVANSISDHKEFLNLERVVIERALSAQQDGASGGLSAALRREFESSLAGQEQALARFNTLSERQQKELLDQTLTGSDLRKAILFQGEIQGLGANANTKLSFTAVDWDSAISAKADLLRQVEYRIDQSIVEDATIERDDLQRTVLVETGLLLSMLLLAILFAWLVARSMARSLRELRHGALTVAQYGLPQTVARLRDPALAIQASPEEVAKQIAEPLPVRSRDEFGQVTEAFNAVHLEAVRTAAEQAQLRASVATMFVNLARRSQILVDRLIGHLDRLERGEEDPDRLGELFQLDHLATRMRRNDENLLVLAGADSSRVQREPAPLMDVLRAAQSEVEHYTRIEFTSIDREVEIAAHAVNDMVHLIAELLDNATAFSPPDSAVIVEARRHGDRAVLLVEDRGIGVSPDQMRELNDKLAHPPVVDVAVSRMMGLVVVARLAARHGVRVELRRARERGTVADIALPPGVLVQRAGVGRGPAGMPVAGGPGADRQLPPAQRGPLASPMALEGGSGMAGRQPADLAGAASGGALSQPPTSAAAGGRLSNAFGRQHAQGAPTPGGNGAMPARSPGLFSPNNAAPVGNAPDGPTPAGPTALGPGRSAPAPVAPLPAAPPPVSAPPVSSPQPAMPPAGPPPAGPTSASSLSGPSNGSTFGGGQRPRRSAVRGPGRGTLPPWSDLTGISANEPEPEQPVAANEDPLPQRRAGDHWTVDGELAEEPNANPIPRQRSDAGPQPMDGMAAAPAPSPLPDVSREAPPVAGMPVQAPAVPPAWPPAASETGQFERLADTTPRGEVAGDEQAEVEMFGPAVDMTAEIPRIRDDWEPAPAEAPKARSANGTSGASAANLPDETMELPIFRALESAWFRTQRPTPIVLPKTGERVAASGLGANGGGDRVGRDSSAVDEPTVQRTSLPPRRTPITPVSDASADARRTSAPPLSPPPTIPPASRPAASGLPTRTPTPPPTPTSTPLSPAATPASPVVPAATPPPLSVPPRGMPEPVSATADRPAPTESVTWRTAADEGWQAAEAIARERDFAMTETGLPKRVPMSQLVPGGIEKGTTTAHRRTPEGVRGLLSAYHRGVQRGRSSQQPATADPRTPQPTQAGPRTPQGGKEHEA